MAGTTGKWERQRGAALRNRAAILEAATELFARDGVDTVDVRQIADAAGVGVGTLYRRFGDKAGVMADLVGEQERQLQDDLLAGPAPLGPGAPPHLRLEEFLRRLADLTERNLELLHACEAATSSRHRLGGYGSWHQHVSILVRQIDPAVDAAFYADLVLSPLTPGLYAHHRHERGLSARELADRVVQAVGRLLPAPTP